MLTDKQKQLIKDLDSVKKSAKTRTEYNAYQQMLTRIRRFGYDAIEDLLYLIEQLPEDELKKIFSDERINELFKITEKTLDVADWKVTNPHKINEKLSGNEIPTQDDIEELKNYPNKVVEELTRKNVLMPHVMILLSHCLSASELAAFEDLMKKHNGYIGIYEDISKLDSEIAKCLRKSNSLSEFIKTKGLEGEFESYQSELMKRPDITFENFIKYLKTPEGRAKIKSKNNYTDEQIDLIIKSLKTD
jgi:hypothetical protein